MLGAEWLWGGGRLYGVTALGTRRTAARYSYYGQPGVEPPAGAPDPGATWSLASISYGAGAGAEGSAELSGDKVWARFGFGWRGRDAEGEQQDGIKIGRVIESAAHGLLSWLGLSWQHDSELKLTDAYAGIGSYKEGEESGANEVFRFGLDDAGQLEWMSREPSGGRVELEHGEQGRILSRSDAPGELFEYDLAGRRTRDDRNT